MLKTDNRTKMRQPEVSRSDQSSRGLVQTRCVQLLNVTHTPPPLPRRSIFRDRSRRRCARSMTFHPLFVAH